MISSPVRFALIVLVLSVAHFPLKSDGGPRRVKGSFSNVTVHKCDMIVKAVEMMTGVERSGSSDELSIITDVVIIVPDQVFGTHNNKCYNAWTHLSSQLCLFVSFQLCSALPHPNWTRPSGYGQMLVLISCDDLQTVQILLSDSVNLQSLTALNFMVIQQGSFTQVFERINKSTKLTRLLTAELTDPNQMNINIAYRPTSSLEWNQRVVHTIVYNNSGIPESNSLDGSLADNELFSERRLSDFCKQNLRVAGVMDSTYAYDTNITQEQSGLYVFQDSFAAEVLRALEYTMNFTLVPKVTKAWGHLVNNTTWQGMIALLLSDEADLAISSTADRPFRRQVIDFNMPTNEIRLSAFFRRPNSISTSSALLEPFNRDFWIGISLWLIVASLSLIVFKKVIEDCHTDSDSEAFWSHLDCFQWSLSTVCLQGFYNYPSQTSVRILIAVGSLSGVLFYGAYAGTLISFLSVVIEPISNLGQLVATDYIFSVVDEPLALKFLEESPSEHDQAIFNRRRKEPKYKTMQEAMKPLNKGSFVFLVDHMSGFDSLNQDFSNEEACKMRDMVIPNGQQKQGSMVNKNSTIKRVIDYQILRMFESGLIKRWTKTYLQRKPNCDIPLVYEGVRFDSVFLAFACLGLMLGLAISMFAVENSVSRLILTKTNLIQNVHINLNHIAGQLKRKTRNIK